MAENVKYWSSVAKRVLYIALTVLTIYFLYKCSLFYMPFLIAFIISLIMEPAIRFIMKKFNLTRRLSSIIIFIITFGIIIGSLIWGLTTLISESANLLQGLNNYTEKAYIQFQQLVENLDITKIKLSNELINIMQESVSDVLESLSTWVSATLKNTLNVLTQIPKLMIYCVITILSLYFICTDKIYILDLAEHHMPKSWIKKISTHIRDITRILARYFKAQLILVFVTFAICLTGLYMFMLFGLNVRYPLLMALIIAFIDALPILGSGTIIIPWAIISALDGDLTLGIVLVILWIAMCVTRQFLEPKVISNKIGIHPIFTLIAMYTGFRVAGISGLLIGPIILIISKNIFGSLIEQGIIKTILDKN